MILTQWYSNSENHSESVFVNVLWSLVCHLVADIYNNIFIGVIRNCHKTHNPMTFIEDQFLWCLVQEETENEIVYLIL